MQAVHKIVQYFRFDPTRPLINSAHNRRNHTVIVEIFGVIIPICDPSRLICLSAF